MTQTRAHARERLNLQIGIAILVALGVACARPTEAADDGLSEAHKQCDGYVGRYEACLHGASSNDSLHATRVAELKESLNGAMGGDRNSRIVLAKRCEREADKLQNCGPSSNDRREVAP